VRWFPGLLAATTLVESSKGDMPCQAGGSSGLFAICILWYNCLLFLRREMVTRREAAVRVDEKRINEYELVLILKPELADEAVESVLNSVSQFIAGKGGEMGEIDKWGRRRLAYPIEHFLEGYYVLAKFKMNPAWSKELESGLQISDDVLRHMLVRLGE
jgi:small subunit ribosomal protein S6